MDQSIADILRASIENAPADKPLSIAIPVFDPPLYMSLRKLKDAKVIDQAMEGVNDIKDELSKALEMGVRTLILACDKTYIEQDGNQIDLPKIGMELHSVIYPDANPAPSTDVEAVFALYTAQGECDTVSLSQAAIQYGEWRNTTTRSAQETVLGE